MHVFEPLHGDPRLLLGGRCISRRELARFGVGAPSGLVVGLSETVIGRGDQRVQLRPPLEIILDVREELRAGGQVAYEAAAIPMAAITALTDVANRRIRCQRFAPCA
jgi:hypothetical protein